MSRVLVVGHLTLDAICSQVTRTAYFDVPQGAALGSALAAAASGASVSLIAKVGLDYPEHVLEALEGNGIQTRHVKRDQTETLRFWILRENGGYCVDHPYASTAIADYTPFPESLALSPINEFDAAHICPMPILDQMKWVEHLRTRVRLISLDPQPFRYADPSIRPQDLFPELLQQVDILSISLEDFPDLATPDVPTALRSLLDAGPRVVTLKMGSAGSAVAIQGNEEWSLFRPAEGVPVDETGAGDSYAGSFLAWYASTGDVDASGKRACATASVMISNVGMLHMNGATEAISLVEGGYDVNACISRMTLTEPFK